MICRMSQVSTPICSRESKRRETDDMSFMSHYSIFISSGCVSERQENPPCMYECITHALAWEAGGRC